MAFINFTVNDTHFTVAPGASVELAVTVENLTMLLDQVMVQLQGIDALWVKVIPQQLPVFAQNSATARVIITPPNDPAQAQAGVYPIGVSGISQESRGQEGKTTTELEVQLVGDYQLQVRQSGAQNGQQVSYIILIKNAANADLQLQLTGTDQKSALWFKFEPFQFVVPAGGTASANLTVRTKSPAAGTPGLVFNLAGQGEFLLKGGSRATAPGHQLSGQFTQAAAARLALTLLPLPAPTFESGIYDVQIANPGASPVSIRLDGRDPSGTLNFNITPAQLTLPPQGSARARLVVQLTPAQAATPRQPHPFQVSATPLDDSGTVVTSEATIALGMAAQPASGAPLWLLILIGILGFIAIVLLFLIVATLR